MGRRYRGNFITANPPTASTTATTGIWTRNQELVQVANSAWQPATLGVFGVQTAYPTSTTQSNNYAVATDGSGNIYTAGTRNLSKIAYSKFDTFGNLIWQKIAAVTGVATSIWAIKVDSSGNIYAACNTYIFKFDSSGAISIQKNITDYAGSGTVVWRSVALDGSGNVYFAGETSSASFGTDSLIAKFDSSFNLQWARSLFTSSTEKAWGIDVDSSGNSYVVISDQGTASVVVAKYDTSGTLQWQRKLNSTANTFGLGIALDPTYSNVYVTGYYSGSGATASDAFIVKYNSSGTIQWQKYIRGTGSGYGYDEIGYSVAVDPSGNVYVSGMANSNQEDFVVKFDSSGNVLFQRDIPGIYGAGSYAATGARSIAVDSSSMYLALSMADPTWNYSALAFARLPNDGNKTGSYTYGTTWTYAASSYTIGTSTLTDSAGTLSSTTPTINVNAGGWSVTSDSLSYYIAKMT